MNEQQEPHSATPPVAPAASSQTGGDSTAGSAPKSTDQEKNKHIAMASRVPFLFWLPYTSDAKNDPTVMFHANQGLLLLGVFVVAQLLYPILYQLMWIAHLAVLGFMVWGIIGASNGEKNALPLIGHVTVLK